MNISHVTRTILILAAVGCTTARAQFVRVVKASHPDKRR
jgi:hypothetical protein